MRTGRDIVENIIPYGPVRVTKGPWTGIIGEYDDDDVDETGDYGAIVYLGTIFMNEGYIFLPHNSFREADSNDLLQRAGELAAQLGIGGPKLPLKGKIRLLQEYRYIQSLLADRMFRARFEQPNRGLKIFISHSSRDKDFVRVLAVDLVNAGHRVWFDEWMITAGDSIPSKISQGLSGSNVLLLILTRESTNSRWVEAEWQSMHWSEIESGKIKLIPVLKEKCRIPALLRHRKYADFSSSYSDGLEELLVSLKQNDRR